jgi:predicted ATP-binding protein involved in virulence
MKVNTISIKNFRGFRNFRIDFGESTTIVIGKNGSGKSNLLNALMKSLTIIPGSIEGNYLKKSFFSTFDANRNSLSGQFNYPIEIDLEVNFGHRPLKWSLVLEKRIGRMKTSYYKEAISFLYNHFNYQESTLPVLACFSDCYPHVQKNLSKYAKQMINARNPIARNFGYYEWDSQSNDGGIWRKRFINTYRITSDYGMNLNSLKDSIVRHSDLLTDTNIDEGLKLAIKSNKDTYNKILDHLKVLNTEITSIEEKLLKFSNILLATSEPSFKIIKITANIPEDLQPKLDFHFSNGTNIFFDSLPMGYKRIFSIVMDICYRNFILNQNSEPNGIVIIDEIELHLHPTLANNIINAFKQTFPDIQFIFSSHSPQVITSLKKDAKNKIFSLENDGEAIMLKEIDNYYGADYESIIRQAMGVEFRNQVLENMINSYKVFKKYNHLDEAAQLKQRIISYAGEGNININKLDLD